jgi:glycosyltransferase involved in cell wall biosynthesis
MVDSVRLVRLAGITQEGLVPMPWAGGERGWWNDLEAWSFSAVTSANGKDAARILRHAMSITSATQADAASSLANTGEADGFSVLLPSLRDSIRARALLDPASYIASTQEGEMHPEGDSRIAEDALGLYTGDSAQHDQLPWVELFDRWLLDDSARAETDDVDAWLAAHSAAFDMGAAANAVHPVEMALVVADDGLSGEGAGGYMNDEDEDGNPPLPFETLHNDSFVVNTPTVRKRPHRFIRPKVLRFGMELHPIHPSLSEQAMTARSRRKREEEDELNERAKEFGATYDPMAGFRDKDGNVMSEEDSQKILESGAGTPSHLQGSGRAVMDLEKDGWAKIVAQLYERAEGDFKRLLPPRWMADAGYPIEEAVPDKMLLTARTIRSGFESLMQAELDDEDEEYRRAKAGELPEHVLREADAETDMTRRARVLAAAKVAAGLQRPRESVMLPSRRLVLWCGRTSPEKQPLLFAKALHFLGSLIQETPLIPAVCIDGPDESLNRKMEELTLMAHPNAVILSGFLGPGRMAELFARTALYVHTAEYEAYGMTPVEAAAFGVPTLGHHPGCAAGSVCVSSIAGAASGKLNISDPTESLSQCADRLASYRRGETNVLMRLYEREQGAAAETANEDDDAAKQLTARAERVATEHDRVLTARKSHPRPRINGAPSMADARSAAPAVGSFQLLKPSLGRSFGTDMTAEPWQLALSMGRVLCRLGMQPDFAEAGLDNHNFQDKYQTTHDIPYRPGVSVPALSPWINADYRARSRALRMMDARTGASGQEHENMLKCRQEAIMGFQSKLQFTKHVDECACLGIGAEHRAHALPIGRGERVAAKIRDTDDEAVLEGQDQDAAGAGRRPHKPLPHPGCVGLAARQAALAWTDDDSAASLMRTLVRTVKDSRKAAQPPSNQ